MQAISAWKHNLSIIIFCIGKVNTDFQYRNMIRETTKIVVSHTDFENVTKKAEKRRRIADDKLK